MYKERFSNALPICMGVIATVIICGVYGTAHAQETPERQWTVVNPVEQSTSTYRPPAIQPPVIQPTQVVGTNVSLWLQEEQEKPRTIQFVRPQEEFTLFERAVLIQNIRDEIAKILSRIQELERQRGYSY